MPATQSVALPCYMGGGWEKSMMISGTTVHPKALESNAERGDAEQEGGRPALADTHASLEQ